MSIHKSTLPNGVRVLTESVGHVGSASIGLWCRTGSADERNDEAGITHLIEHMLFKGTARRTSHQIAEEIEGRGGMLNAFTDKQATCYYCRVLKEDTDTAVDVLSDMLTGSLIDEEELGREKHVVLEEIKRSEDEPGDQVHDLHLEARWPGHPLGKPIIGTKESVASFTADKLKDYMARQYVGGSIMLAAAGNVEHDEVVAWAQERLGGIPAGEIGFEAPRPTGRAGQNAIHKEIEQVHFCIGSEAPSLYDEDLYAAALLDHVLGGGMSSRLFQEVREKRGLAYAIGTYSLNYSHGGAMTVYGGTGLETWPQVQEIVHAEFAKVRHDGPGDDELAKAKRSLCGSLVLSLESMSSRMMRMSRNEFVRGREVPVEETVAKIEAITRESVIEAARKFLDPSLISVTAIQPAA